MDGNCFNCSGPRKLNFKLLIINKDNFLTIGNRPNDYFCVSAATCETLGWKLYNNKCYEKCPLGSIICTTDATTCEPCVV